MKNIPWKGLSVLFILLTLLSVIAFLLSSIEGFATGVVVILIGWLVSFFREDIKRLLGISSKPEEVKPVKLDDDNYLWKLEKSIVKGREKIEKTISKYESEFKSYKQQKIARDIVEQATLLIAKIDQAKSCAIQTGHNELLEHYDVISQEIKEMRTKYQELASRVPDE